MLGVLTTFFSLNTFSGAGMKKKMSLNSFGSCGQCLIEGLCGLFWTSSVPYSL